MRRFLSLLVKESIQFSRDRAMLFLILYLYTAEVVMCTVALTFDVKHVALAIVDQDQSVRSRELIERFTVVEEFRAVGRPATEAEAGRWLQSGRAVMALVIPRGFAERIGRQEAAPVQVLLDGTNSNTAAIARAYALQIVGEFERAWAARLGHTVHAVEPLRRVWYNQNLTFASFMVLSMIALASMMVGVIQPAASIVREKETGTIEQLMVTPISLTELFVAKTLPTLVMCLLAIFPSLLVAHAFDVPMRGNLTAFLFLTAIFLVSAISLGVLIASVTRTLQQALLVSFFGLFPLLFLSGTIVPVESMPRALQLASLASPLRHYMEVILSVFLKGAGLAQLWPQMLALLGIGAVLFAAALAAFRR
ncbi:MAG TPA: ABC transporter permease [Steroidobacteraceae bacterium]|nr:ABC transporter permease [Steroidobacteraceae bacterium]